ncbi:hypothetical protein BGZ76_005847 [Entomortierella beljakovae]|nr:hypothetical protein BGZ76_005847 [Entomortierella beljakovae]
MIKLNMSEVEEEVEQEAANSQVDTNDEDSVSTTSNLSDKLREMDIDEKSDEELLTALQNLKTNEASKLALYEKVVQDIQDLNQHIKHLEDINSDGSELSSKTTDTASSKYGALKVTSDFPKVRVSNEPRIFLGSLRHKAIAYVGPESFEKLATRYLSYHIESEYDHDAIEREITKDGKQVTWEQCKTMLLKIVLTEQERFEQIRKLLEIGRKYD